MKTEEQFVLKEDGKIYLVTMPDSSDFVETDDNVTGDFDQKGYEDAIQSAIGNAVEVSNQDEAMSYLAFAFGVDYPNHVNKIYSLQCSVEIKHMKYKSTNNGQYMVGAKPFALVSFQPPVEEGEKETQDELWDEVEYWINFEDRYLNSTEVKKRFTITRKP